MEEDDMDKFRDTAASYHDSLNKIRQQVEEIEAASSHDSLNKIRPQVEEIEVLLKEDTLLTLKDVI